MTARDHIHQPQSRGDHVADQLSNRMGSWRFIIIQTVIVVTWISLNSVELLFHPFDVYPFVLLNLLFSTQAAYTGPVVMMSQNRQAAKDRLRDDLEAKEVEKLLQLQTEQMSLLLLQHHQLGILKAIKRALTGTA